MGGRVSRQGRRRGRIQTAGLEKWLEKNLPCFSMVDDALLAVVVCPADATRPSKQHHNAKPTVH